MNKNTVYVVHTIDTEGPLYESLRANFERIEEMTGHKIDVSVENLNKLQNKKMDLGGDEEKVSRILSGKRISTHQSWDQIDKMLDEITSTAYRNEILDSYGEGWIFNWLCMSHVGITGLNPRRRDMGYHNIYDHYQEYFDKKGDYRDLIQWHYHALSLTNDAHHAGSTYLNSDHIYKILSRSIIERSWFPAVFRAGHNTIRPDSHFFLEQWIPFDFSSSSFDKAENPESPARFGDWRRAPKSWIPYHPSHDDYQKPGSCNRYIARCASIDDRGYSLSYDDACVAFEEARDNGASIFAVTNHDFREMAPDINLVRKYLTKCKLEYPDVDFKFSNAIDAMRSVFDMKQTNEIGFSLEIKEYKSHSKLIIKAENEVFGVQPFLALKTKTNEYVWQNLDFESESVWSYSFDSYNLLLSQVDEIGVAANTSNGLTEIINFNPQTGKQKKTILNS
jgi:hypothetical protein